MTQLELTFVLVTVFQVKHFVADFPLQTRYMLRKVAPGMAFLLPLTAHCSVHAILTLIVVLALRPSLWWLAILDFVCHFLMDRIKASPRGLGNLRNDGWAYWAAFGFDQMIHHLTHLYIIWILVTW